MLTTSAVEMMQTFTTDIVKLKARGSNETRNPDALIREYGLDREQKQSHKVTLNYRQLREHVPGEGIVIQNPLTEAAVDDITEEIRNRLQYDADVKADLTVSKLVVDATLPELEAETRAMSSEFELTFVSDTAQPAPGDDRGARSLTRQKNRDRGLYSELSWNINNLNLHRVEETQAKYPNQGDGLIMSWQGPGDTRPRSTEPIATIVNNEVCPDEYSATKWFGVAESDETELRMIRT
jgi:hypothetical protein